jgi:Serine carboxypeptidase
MHLHNEY